MKNLFRPYVSNENINIWKNVNKEVRLFPIWATGLLVF